MADDDAHIVRTTDPGRVRDWARVWGLRPRLLHRQLSLTDGQETSWDHWLALFEAHQLQLVFEAVQEDGPRSVVYRLEPR